MAILLNLVKSHDYRQLLSFKSEAELIPYLSSLFDSGLALPAIGMSPRVWVAEEVCEIRQHYVEDPWILGQAK